METDFSSNKASLDRYNWGCDWSYLELYMHQKHDLLYLMVYKEEFYLTCELRPHFLELSTDLHLKFDSQQK